AKPKPQPVTTTLAPVTSTPTPAGIAAQPGSYSGQILNSLYYYLVSLYVSSDGTQVQDVTLANTTLSCSLGGTLGDHIASGEATIAANGSFSATATQTGIVGHSAAKFTYTVSGQFSGTNVAGSVREDVTYSNGIAYSCTTGTQTWSAKRDMQGVQTASPPSP